MLIEFPSQVCLLIAHSDFFQPQKESADIFFLRWIFHNWSNKYSLQILRNLIPAMKPGTKIIINDFLLPEPNTLPWGLERAIRWVLFEVQISLSWLLTLSFQECGFDHVGTAERY